MITSCSILLSRQRGLDVRLLAWATVTIENSWRINDLRIIRHNEGLKVFCPSRHYDLSCPVCNKFRQPRFEFCPMCGAKTGKLYHEIKQDKRQDTFYDLAHPVTKEARSDMETIIFEALRIEEERAQQTDYDFEPARFDVRWTDWPAPEGLILTRLKPKK